MIVSAVAGLSLGIWIYLVLFRGGFWRVREIDTRAAPARDQPPDWPAIAVVIPARDEAELIGLSAGSLLDQRYPGPLHVFVVDDQSSDGTANVANRAAEERKAGDRLRVIDGRPVPAGWTGKPWAMQQGFLAVEALENPPPLVLFTDADIRYDPGALQRLVAIALSKETVLTSLMVKLRLESFAERFFVPAFVFFFQMLYPFAWVNDPRRRVAAAAGGCMLIRREALRRAGGLEALRGALIDDCAMGAVMKAQGPVWLGLTENVHSLRAYPTISSFGAMVSRSAFAELRYSTARLIGTVIGLLVTYLAPPLLAFFAVGIDRAVGLLVWFLMAVCFAPILSFYRRPIYVGLGLPMIAVAYLVFTIQSAVNYWQGKGGYWKGRVQAPLRQIGKT